MTLVPEASRHVCVGQALFALPLPLLIERCTCDKLTASLFPLRDKTPGGVRDNTCDPETSCWLTASGPAWWTGGQTRRMHAPTDHVLMTQADPHSLVTACLFLLHITGVISVAADVRRAGICSAFNHHCRPTWCCPAGRTSSVMVHGPSQASAPSHAN